MDANFNHSIMAILYTIFDLKSLIDSDLMNFLAALIKLLAKDFVIMTLYSICE